MKLIIVKIERAFDLTKDLVEHLSQDNLSLHLGNLPSNKIGDQIWCIIGARESYLKAIQASQWSRFSCSLQDSTSKSEVLYSLNSSSQAVVKYLKGNSLSEYQMDIALDLLEHEIMHHGQLIRYIYANKLLFPKSWNKRYILSPKCWCKFQLIVSQVI